MSREGTRSNWSQWAQRKRLSRILGQGANFYNGEKSTAAVAGNVGNLQWSNASFGEGATISGVFSSDPGVMALSSWVKPNSDRILQGNIL